MFVGALDRHEMKSILELMGNSGIGNAFFLKELELISLELKFAITKLNPQINLLLNFLIQKYLFHDNPT